MILPMFENKCELKDLGLVKDENTNEYYLTATYRVEDENEIRGVTIPKIKLPVVQDSLMVDVDTKSTRLFPDVSIAMGFGTLDIEYGKDGKWFYETVIHEKVHEMTLEEVEKKLGHKVKIVSEKRGTIKSSEMCNKCAFGVGNGICGKISCQNCNLNNRAIGRSHCRCTDIRHGDVCPYFKEVWMKNILCRLGFHKPDKYHYVTYIKSNGKRSWRVNYAVCERCGKRLGRIRKMRY